MRGNAGNDIINVGDVFDHIYGDEGDDIITVGNGNASSNYIYGNDGNDTITIGDNVRENIWRRRQRYNYSW